MIVKYPEIDQKTYFDNSKCELRYVNSEYVFSKYTEISTYGCWFGFKIDKGILNLSFDIMFEDFVSRKNDVGVKVGDELFNFFMDNVVPKIYQRVNIRFARNEPTMIKFTLDGLNSSCNVHVKSILISNKISLAIFGFGRNFSAKISDETIFTMDKYIRIPTHRSEDIDAGIMTENVVRDRFRTYNRLDFFEYDRSKFIDAVNSYGLPRFGRLYHQFHRVISMFSAISESCGIVDLNKADGTIIIIRSDIGINSINYERINELLRDNDIIVHTKCIVDNLLIGYDDKYIIMKRESIFKFMKFYEKSLEYIEELLEDKTRHTYEIINEGILKFHLDRCNFKVVGEKVIDYIIEHYCTKFCRCHGAQSKE